MREVKPEDALFSIKKRYSNSKTLYADCNTMKQCIFFADAPQRLLRGAGGGGQNGGFDKHVFVRCQRYQLYIFGHLNRDGGGTST